MKAHVTFSLNANFHGCNSIIEWDTCIQVWQFYICYHWPKLQRCYEHFNFTLCCRLFSSISMCPNEKNVIFYCLDNSRKLQATIWLSNFIIFKLHWDTEGQTKSKITFYATCWIFYSGLDVNRFLTLHSLFYLNGVGKLHDYMITSAALPRQLWGNVMTLYTVVDFVFEISTIH